MLIIFIRYFFVLTSFFYIYFKLLNLKVKNKFQIYYSIVSILVISTISSNPCITNTLVRLIMTMLTSYIFITYLSKSKLLYSFFISSIAFCFSLVFYIIANILSCFIFLSYYKDAQLIPYLYAALVSGLIQILLIYLVFKSKRFQNGIRLLTQNNHALLGAIISITFIICLSVISIYKSNILSIQTAVIIHATIWALLILVFWNHRITQTYREKLRLANEKSLEDELANKLTEIEFLKADNERLSRLIHKDNKLIPAMHMAVTDFLENVDELTTEELSAHGHELSLQLHKMADDRQGILNEAPTKTNTLPQTGIHTVDGVLSYMETRAAKENIIYKLHIEDNIKELIPNFVSEDDLCHLLSDLIENAIIATRYSTNQKQIKIHLGTLKNTFLLEISDSGIEFDVETYQHLGYEKHTTHAEHGGSGIGLMDIWKIKKQNKISLQIYEYPPDSTAYTKKISFVFDRKNHFLMQTYRYKEIIGTLTRGDLYVFPYESKENI